MMAGPRVSVILSVYNDAPTLGEAIRSVLTQSLSDLELIVIDDGSTDDVGGVVDSFPDPRIRFFTDGRNQGLSARLNQGIGLARGEYIARMDADDICTQRRLERQVDYLDRHADVAACGTWMQVELDDGRTKLWKYPLKAADVRAGLLFNNTLAHPTLMVRNEVIAALKPAYEEWPLRAEDYEMLTRLTDRYKVVNLGFIGLRYRRVSHVKTDGPHAQSRATARKIRNTMIQRLGITASEEELQLHHHVCDALYTSSDMDLPLVVAWFDRLNKANRQAGLLDEAVLRHLLVDKFYRLCRRHDPAGRLTGKLVRDASFFPNPLRRFAFRLRLLLAELRQRYASHPGQVPE